MKKDKYAKDEMIARAIYYYYMDEMTQEEVSHKLDISRISVVRLLEEGRKRHLVQVHVSPNIIQSCLELEQEMLQRLPLAFCRVIPSDKIKESDDLSLLQLKQEKVDRLAKSMSVELLKLVNDDDTVAVGFGYTLTSLLSCMSPSLVNNRSTVSLVSLSGGVGYYIQSLGSQYFASNHAKIQIVPAPLIVRNPELSKLLLQEPAVSSVLNVARNANYALLGIGSMHMQATLRSSDYLTAAHYQQIDNSDAVGDILGYFYDANGKILELDHHRSLIGLDLNSLLKIPFRIALALGEEKINSICGALRGGWINGLATDEATAKLLLMNY